MLNCSIALATFNGQRFLKAQLDSIAAQSAPPAEMVIADDSSTDGSLGIVRSFAESAPFPVRIIENASRLGYRANFMRAAAACTSDLIAFCDQDDLWEPTKIAHMQEVFSDDTVLLAYHAATLIDESNRVIGDAFRASHAKAFAPLTMHPSQIIPGLVQVLRRSLIRLTPLHPRSIDPYAPDQQMPHDQWYPFWASVLGNIAYVPRRLVRYRQHDANVSGWPVSLRAFVLNEIKNAKLYAVANDLAAENRLALLRQARELMSNDDITRIDAGISYYEDYRKTTQLRRQMYEAPTRIGRMRDLLSLLGSGVYAAKRTHDLWPSTLLLDAFVGVPITACGTLSRS